ncbi:MAG: HWE histidine kinase domain-containing protein [Roseiarcus sp.]
MARNDIAFETGDHRVEHVSLTVEPLPDRSDGRPLFLIAFEEKSLSAAGESTPAGDSEKSDPPDRAEQTELELRDTRERLQGTIEEYETALEELKSANEELISLNEEMQSSNEELESTKEELQSLNEELQTVNNELCAKIEDLDRANGDLTNLFASTNVATIFLDRNLVIRSFTPAVSQLFNIIATDKGRPLGDLAIKLDYPELQADIAAVLASGTPIDRQAHKNEAHAPYFLARLTPYRNSEHGIDGVVATFVDVTSLAKSEERHRNLVSELNHRVKNMLAVIVAITQQTLARAASPDDFAKAFFARIQAMARSHELLSRQNWGEVGVEEMVRQGLAPYFPPDNRRIALSGPAMKLPSMIALGFGMIIDELATNAVKYGALSNEIGHVSVEWSASGDDVNPSALTLAWRESGGPPVKPPAKMGFGLKVIKREIEYSNSGTAQFDFAEGGFSARLEVPLKRPREAQP